MRNQKPFRLKELFLFNMEEKQSKNKPKTIKVKWRKPSKIKGLHENNQCILWFDSRLLHFLKPIFCMVMQNIGFCIIVKEVLP